MRRARLGLLTSIAGVLAAGHVLVAQDIIIITSTIEGTVATASVPATQISVTASPQFSGGGTSTSTPFVSAGAASTPYSLLVGLPQTGSGTFNVTFTIRSDGNRDVIQPTAVPVLVSSDAPATLNYTLPDVGYIAPVFDIVNAPGATVTFASITAFFSATGVSEFAASSGSLANVATFPVIPRSNIRITGSVNLSNGVSRTLDVRFVDVAAGETTQLVYTVDGTPPPPPPPATNGSIGGTIAFTGDMPVQRFDILASGPTFRSIVLQPPPPDGAYLLSSLAAGTYGMSANARLNNFDDTMVFPLSAFSPSRTGITVADAQTTVDISAPQSFIEGMLVLTGGGTLLPFATNGSIAITGLPGTASGGFASDQLQIAARSIDLVATPGDWRVSHVQMNFSRPAPGLSGSLSYVPVAANPTITAEAGETVHYDLPIAFGELTLTISASGGQTFTNPRVTGNCIERDSSNAVLHQSSFSFSTFNQVNVSQGSVTIVSSSGRCSLTPRVQIGSQLLTLPTVQIDIVAGASQTVDVGGPTMTITSPSPGIVGSSLITVSGRATDDVAVAGVTVNGNPAFIGSANNPADPREILFNRTISLVRGPNLITTVASDTSSPPKTATDARTVYFDTQLPTLFVTAPADGTSTVASSISVTGTANDDAGVQGIVVNGVPATTVPTGGANHEVSFSATVPLAVGSNTLSIVATDISTRTTTVTRTVTREQRVATSLIVAAATGVFGGNVTVSATLTADGSPVAGKTIVFGLNGVQAGSVTDAQGVAAANLTLAGLNAGAHTGAISAAFAQDDTHLASGGTGDLTVEKASATLALGALQQTYDGAARHATATTDPAGLQGVTLTYDGSPAAPMDAGSYAVVASLTNPNYAAPDAHGTLVVAKAAASLVLGGLAHTYDGSPKAAVATTTPAGLDGVTLTYDGGATLPVNAGSYAVAASLTHRNYEAPAAHGTLVIDKAAQSIAFGAIDGTTFGDAPFDVTATATSGLPVEFAAAGQCIVSGAQVTLTAGGSCTITATQPGNGNFHPAPPVSRAFSIAWPWSNLLAPVKLDGTSVFKLNSTVPVKFALTGAAAGVSTLSARIYLAKLSSGVLGTELEALSTSAADTGNLFRYDATADQYIFNLGTRPLSQGTWQLRVDLGDGSTNVVLISLKK